MPSLYSMENVLLGVRLVPVILINGQLIIMLILEGFTITCPGNPGHGSRTIANTAVEKVVCFRR